mmetsp:Transcript_42042/g.132508  ORF Transcript_42042/g.132508 Transcript_42042/m.132508 type:complete len:255 (-) Transcript_42042:478-1242(-)
MLHLRGPVAQHQLVVEVDLRGDPPRVLVPPPVLLHLLHRLIPDGEGVPLLERLVDLLQRPQPVCPPETLTRPNVDDRVLAELLQRIPGAVALVKLALKVKVEPQRPPLLDLLPLPVLRSLSLHLRIGLALQDPQVVVDPKPRPPFGSVQPHHINGEGQQVKVAQVHVRRQPALLHLLHEVHCKQAPVLVNFGRDVAEEVAVDGELSQAREAVDPVGEGDQQVLGAAENLESGHVAQLVGQEGEGVVIQPQGQEV